VAVLSLATAVYAAGMALVQQEARRFFCFLFLSHSALVLVGIDTVSPVGLTGGLSVWLSVGLALTGFGLTLRSVESRLGRLSLREYHGLAQYMPTISALFLMTGLASVGFPGTFGFVGTELLVDGAIQLAPQVGFLVALATALNGIAVLHVYFRVFNGSRYAGSLLLQIRVPERIAVVALAALILGGGVFPQPGIASRHRAAVEMLEARRAEQTAGQPSDTPGQFLEPVRR
jgi:NADH-quinone oxidoreductase subunit M